MNEPQKKVLKVVSAVVGAMLLFPPYQIIGRGNLVIDSGYAFLFDLPTRGSLAARVDVSTLFLQWVGVAIIGGIIIFLVKAK